jgi:hypothetical protein
MKRKWLTIGIILMFIATGSFTMIFSVPLCRAEPNNEYFENVNVSIIGYCNNISSVEEWHPPIFIGNLKETFIVASYYAFHIGLRITIFNESISNPWVSFFSMHVAVHMNNADGIFFWASLRQNPTGILKSRFVFVHCHAEEVWIQPLDK